jgi:hypothetical protein
VALLGAQPTAGSDLEVVAHVLGLVEGSSFLSDWCSIWQIRSRVTLNAPTS